jgi:hypothetical protein
MRSFAVGLALAVAGVVVAKIGQGIFAVRYDWLWAGLAVVSILGGATIVFAKRIERGLQPVTRRSSRS